jgi:hypothetical protein
MEDLNDVDKNIHHGTIDEREHRVGVVVVSTLGIEVGSGLSNAIAIGDRSGVGNTTDLAIGGSRRTSRSTAATVQKDNVLHRGVEEFIHRGTIIVPIALDDRRAWGCHGGKRKEREQLLSID